MPSVEQSAGSFVKGACVTDLDHSARYEHLRDDAGTTVYVHGEIDLFERPGLVRALDGAVHARDAVWVDLADVSFMDATGMHALADARRAAARRGARFALIAPAPSVCRLLPFWRDTDRFEIRTSRTPLPIQDASDGRVPAVGVEARPSDGARP
jgi:anti-anti-sigma factor